MARQSDRDTPLERYLSVLELVAPFGQGLTAGELERALLLPRATINRIVHVLLDAGLVKLSDAHPRAYSLGPRILQLLSTAEDCTWLEKLTNRPLQELARATGQSAFLVRRVGSEVRSVNCASPDTAVRLHIVPGTVMPPHATASGKAILAFSTPEMRDQMLAADLPACTSRTIVDRQTLGAELARVRELGYSVERGEHVSGLAATALPVLGPEGDARFAVGLTGPEHGIVGQALQENLAALAATRDQLAEALALVTP